MLYLNKGDFMEQNEQKLKEILRGQIRALMPTDSPADFKMALGFVVNSYKQIYIQSGDVDYYTKVMNILKEISYQSIVNRVADKDSEHLLVLNEDGTSTGKFADRKRVHKKGAMLWHREVAAIVIREDGTFAIITRSASKKSYPGAKALVCGHVEGATSYHEAAVTEASEEMGQRFIQNDMIRLMDPKSNPRDDNLAYVCPYIVPSKLASGIFLYQDQEVDGVEWITVEKLEKYINLSNIPEFKDLVIFRDTPFYRGLVAQIKKLISLPDWYKLLTERDYKTLYKELGVNPPAEDIAYYERTKLVGATSYNAYVDPIDTSTTSETLKTTTNPRKR